MPKTRVNVSLSPELLQRLATYRGRIFSHKVEELLWLAIQQDGSLTVAQTTPITDSNPLSETAVDAASSFAVSLRAVVDRLNELEMWRKALPEVNQLERVVDNIDDRLERLEQFDLEQRLQEVEAALEDRAQT